METKTERILRYIIGILLFILAEMSIINIAETNTIRSIDAVMFIAFFVIFLGMRYIRRS